MKTTLSFFAAVLLSISGFAQNSANLVVFSEDLEPFYVYVNGVKQNANYETNVRITNVNENIALRIEFQNKALPVLKQSMMCEPGFEHTARLKYDKNKVMKLRYFGQVAINEAPKDNGAKNIEYHTAEITQPAANTVINTDAQDTQVHSQVSIQSMPVTNVNITTSTVTTTQTTGTPKTDGGGISITMPGVGINMTVTDPTMGGNVQTTTSTTVTTTTTGGMTETSTTSMQSGGSAQVTSKSVKSASVSTPSPAAVAETAAKVDCSVPMSGDAFNRMKTNIESKPFSETKMSVARVATKSACLSVNQVKEITKLFSMDDDKLAYAKFAYDYCVDKANYYEISDAFSFSSTQEELMKFLDK